MAFISTPSWNPNKKTVKDGKQVETPKDKRKETGKEPKKRANVTTKSWKRESYHVRVTDWSVNVLHSTECFRRRGSPKDAKVHWKPQSTQEKSCVSKDRDVGEAPQRKWTESLNQKQLNTQLTSSTAAPTSAGARLWALDRMTPSTGEHRWAHLFVEPHTSWFCTVAPPASGSRSLRNTGCQVHVLPAPPGRSALTTLCEVQHPTSPSTHTGLKSALCASLLNVNGHLKKASNLKNKDNFFSLLK